MQAGHAGLMLICGSDPRDAGQLAGLSKYVIGNFMGLGITIWEMKIFLPIHSITARYTSRSTLTQTA